MKNLWNMISFLAVVNVLAALLFVGWLWRTDRLDLDRVRQVRDLLASTILEDSVDAAADAEAARIAAAAAADRLRASDPPLPAAAHLEQVALQNSQSSQAARRIQDTTEQHLAQLDGRLRQLDEREAGLVAAEEAWKQSIKEEVDRRADEQFAKTIRLYESLAGKQAKRMLLELVAQGSTDQAVSYLDAMNPRSATKTLKELKTDDENRLATELLERLRTFGVDIDGPQEPDDDQLADAANEPDG